MAGIAAGYPIDTIRLRIQMDSGEVSMLKCLRETVVSEGVAGLFKGMSQPLMGSIPTRTIVFTTTEQVKW